jgi:hypothetical protein
MPRNKPALPAQLFTILFVVAAIVFCAPGVLAQESATQNPPPYRGVDTHVEGVFVTPVANVPLTADAEVVSTQVLDDGSSVSKKTFNNIARDSQGRIYNERRSMVPATSDVAPELISFHIFDPTTRLNTFLNPDTHLAHQAVLSERAADQVVAVAQRQGSVTATNRPGYQEQDLGTQSMENVVVHGTRKTRTIPAKSSGTGKPVVVTDEYWYSEELHLNMLVKHDDPRTGQQTVTVTHVDRSEPAAATFEIPADYKIVDETPVQK